MEPKSKIVVMMLSLIISACTTASKKDFAEYSFKLPEVLDQVNGAILKAQSLNIDEKAPVVTSVKLDLQVGVTTKGNAGVPIGLVTTQGEIDKENIHNISLTFKPKATASSEFYNSDKISDLAMAISAVNNDVSKANAGYQFKEGSVQIQCTLKEKVGASLGSGLILTPIQIGANHTHQLIQTVTLNFGPKGAAADPAQQTIPQP
jgi:NTP-dependent ternary system trypsin peptidase co-occuring protein